VSVHAQIYKDLRVLPTRIGAERYALKFNRRVHQALDLIRRQVQGLARRNLRLKFLKAANGDFLHNHTDLKVPAAHADPISRELLLLLLLAHHVEGPATIGPHVPLRPARNVLHRARRVQLRSDVNQLPLVAVSVERESLICAFALVAPPLPLLARRFNASGLQFSFFALFVVFHDWTSLLRRRPLKISRNVEARSRRAAVQHIRKRHHDGDPSDRPAVCRCLPIVVLLSKLSGPDLSVAVIILIGAGAARGVHVRIGLCAVPLAVPAEPAGLIEMALMLAKVRGELLPGRRIAVASVNLPVRRRVRQFWVDWLGHSPVILSGRQICHWLLL
jgi:hypothetical protein